jgi:hypothetical protein
VQPSSSGRGLRVPWIPIAVLLGIVAVVGVVVYLVIQSGKPAKDRFAGAAKVEADPAPDLPGEYVNLPEAWADGSTLAHYGASDGPNTNAHVTHDVDYSKEVTDNAASGLPPAGGPHWGSSSCGNDPATAPAFCGPAPWGIYRVPWHAESLVHNMEHGGTVIWYNTKDQGVISDLEDFAAKHKSKHIVVAPYPDMDPETVAITVWGRRLKMPVSQYDRSKLTNFFDKTYCRFDPEGLC